MTSPARITDRSCGPSDCEVDWLTSERHQADDEVVRFTRWATERGWGDGLPLVPPTEARVRAFLARSGRFPDEVVAELPPLRGECTAEKIAINAVMAGAEPAAMPLIIAAVEAMARPEFNLAALNATTGSVVPAVIVNGPVRDELGIPYEVSCAGGAGGGAPSVGRAIRLVMRNLAGQEAGVTSQSVFGTPGRVAGIVFGEWEEVSPGYDAGLVLTRRHGDRVHIAQSPQDVIVTVCGGMGNLHALSMPSWGDTKSVTAGIR
ncbi:MAG TPA: hypothetical protein VMC03_21455 [Streptosporangiaceae bacterium]|nr:hypothetical protein [Streptosporangiaceae bacterium]